MTQTTLSASNTAKTVALAFFDDAYELIGELYGRWLDEKDYEDIYDYRAPLAKIAEKHGVTITKMTKKPFGFAFTTPQGTYVATARLGSVSYKRIS